MNQTLVVIIGIGTGLCALGLLVQLGLWFAIYGVGRRIQKNVTGVTPKVQSLIAQGRSIYGEVRPEALKIRDSVKDAIAVTKKEVETLHHLRDDATRLMQHERDMADEVFEDAVTRARQTSHFVGRGITTPIRGIAQAIRRLRHAA
jgi:hypothetical protein